MVINVDNSYCYIAGNCFPAVHDLIGHFKVTWHLTIKPFPVKTSECVKLQNAMQWGLMNFQLYNNWPEDWSLGKQLILFPSNLNVFLGRQNLKLFPSGSVMKCMSMIVWKYINRGMSFNAQQFSVTDVGRYICLDNSTLCNLCCMCVGYILCMTYLTCFVAIMPYYKLHAFNCEFQSLLSMPTIKEMEVSNIN